MALNQWFRRHQKKFYVVLGVIIMVTWYMASSLQTLLENLSGKKDVMFGKKISPAEIEAVVRGLAAFRGGSAETPDSLRAQAWEHLMLLNEAQRLGIEAPDQEVKTFICVTEPGEFLLYDQEFFTQASRIVCYPLLEVFTFLETKLREGSLNNLLDLVFGPVYEIHSKISFA